MDNDITYRTPAEKELQKALHAAQASKAQYEQAISMISEVVWRYDVNVLGEYIDSYISPVADRILGLPVGTIGDRFERYLSFIHPEDLSAVQRTLFEVMQSHGKDGTEDKAAEYRLLKADGTHLWVRSRISACFQPDGPVTVFGTTNDITEAKQAEHDYRTLFLEMLDGFALHEIICDGQGKPINYRFLDVNPAFERLTGLKRDDLIGSSILDILPGTEKQWIETYGKVALTGEPAFFEDYSHELNKYFEVRAFRTAVNQFACIFVDITDRKRTEEDLRQSELRLRTIFETSSAGIIIVDTNGRISQANQCLAEMFACPLESMIGTPYPAFIHPEERQDGTDVMQAMLENRADTVFTERHYLRADGSDFWGYISGRRMVGSNGEFTGLLGIISDITDRKRAEDDLRWKIAVLEASVETSLDGILVVNSHGQRILTNQRLLNMWNVPAEIRNEKVTIQPHPLNR